MKFEATIKDLARALGCDHRFSCCGENVDFGNLSGKYLLEFHRSDNSTRFFGDGSSYFNFVGFAESCWKEKYINYSFYRGASAALIDFDLQKVEVLFSPEDIEFVNQLILIGGNLKGDDRKQLHGIFTRMVEILAGEEHAQKRVQQILGGR
ncbi:MAG: hypothetical protein UT24_C0011G0026 [Candidatus Woesebacteria bacterium GW2011_GWB1_39_12]|uniref:Uncharacterized protein n=1 Tax=Candidatus Woesebacteria bacterium GW2011_GWB1_39_12 TaxID=1618574 RepID=A0A0G0MBH8_9BACT|nr:MAG: hypothetical protein UT24_C0011G0026 [Candidatus Woesebacteria bacterium GW2011_GWB1_39_12]